MSNQRKKQSIASIASGGNTRVSKKSNRSKTIAKAAPSSNKKPQSTEPTSKQARLIAMLQSPLGATVESMMKVAGWQQHSVRGFLAGVVRKRLKLNLSSAKIGKRRIYRVIGNVGGDARPRSSKQAG